TLATIEGYVTSAEQNGVGGERSCRAPSARIGGGARREADRRRLHGPCPRHSPANGRAEPGGSTLFGHGLVPIRVVARVTHVLRANSRIGEPALVFRAAG